MKIDSYFNTSLPPIKADLVYTRGRSIYVHSPIFFQHRILSFFLKTIIK